MKEEVDKFSDETWIQLSDEEIRMGFLSQCIEAVAESEKCNYVDILKRMERVDMTEGYILKHYDVLHSQSWKNIIHDLKHLLHKRESDKHDGGI